MSEEKKRILRDKSFYFGNAVGQGMALSVEEALGKNLNDFRGWYCAIGVENLHISPDGNIYGAACRNSGHLGNVYDQGFFLSGKWHLCTRSSCSCGADMQLRKVKDPRYIPQTYLDIPDDLVTDLKDPVYAAPVHQDVHRTHPLTLTWDIGRRCNYSCSYCQPAVSNTYEAHRTWGSLLFAYEGIEKFFLEKRKAKFVFTGGEPTINPSYLELVKLLRSNGHLIHTTTNGSRTADYFADLIDLSFIGFSYHLEFAKIEHYKKVMSAIIERKKSSKQAFDNWCAVRIMVPPGKLNQALQARAEMLALDSFEQVGLMVFLSPCYDKFVHTQMMDYSEDELTQISRLG